MSVVDRLSAALEGRYRIERELGQGGMAVVFLAEDLKHHRKVALKVLKPELAAVVGGDRFLAEIEVTAGLQHPHILPLYDSGEADTFLFFVTPYVEGESLRERLDRERQLPVDEALRIAQAVASGLDYAHRQGVVHRDIKPANILLQDGQPLVADFGIALAVQEAGGGRLTETGLSLGTPYYMSPEQATADRDPGPRSDVYSLACVLHEMLAGEPPFPGTSAQSVLAKILTSEPPKVRTLRSTVPPHVEAVLLKALHKLPADRFAGAADFARALDERGMRAEAGPGVATGAGGEEGVRRGGSGWLPWLAGGVLGAVLALFVGALLGGGSASPDTDAPRLRAVLELPEEAAVVETHLRISDDGEVLVFPGTWNGRAMLLARRLDELEVVPLEGTEEGSYHFLSPDGRWVAFRADGEMRRVPVGGGPVAVMDAEADWAGGDWTEDGTVYYSRSYLSGIWRMSADGGEPEALTEASEGELAHWYPQLLPDGEHVLFTAFRTPAEEASIDVVSLSSGERRELLRGGVFGRYVPSGHLLFARGGALYAVPFDADVREVRGDPVPVLDDVAMTHFDGVAAYDVSPGGTLVYLEGSEFYRPSDLVWVDREGRREAVVEEQDRYQNPALSPDGRRVAVGIQSEGAVADVYVLDLNRGIRSRLTTAAGADFGPMWTPSGDAIAYVSERPVFDLFLRAADASTPARPLVEDGFDKYPMAFTPDGDTLLFQRNTTPAREILKVALGGGEPEAFFSPGFSVSEAALSPDGRWLAYSSNESGRDEVYLSPYPALEASRRQVSVEGGREPLWTRGGRELVFRDGPRMMGVAFDPDRGELGRPEVLFTGPFSASPEGSARSYDVTPDGERFLMVSRPPERAPRRIVVVTDFFDILRERVGEAGPGDTP